MKPKRIAYRIPLRDRTICVEAFTSIDEWLDAAEGDDLPFWAELWPSGRALAVHMDSLMLRGKRLLELGAGVGLPGIVARLRGAEVTQTDRSLAALIMARQNAVRNAVGGIRRMLADWRRFPALGRFDWIVGSDILYEISLHADLAGILGSHLHPGGTVLLADPGRRAAESFVHRMERAGWCWRLADGGSVDGFRIDLLEFRRPGTEP